MQQRSPITVAILSFITFGIYGIYWFVKTKDEMNQRGAQIPTAWFIIVPFVNIWWMWKYSEGVERVTVGRISTILAFIALWLLGAIGIAIIQDSFNKISAAPTANTPASTPQAPVAQ